MADTPTYPNWFEAVARPNFEQHLKRFSGKDGLRFLQIGVFTGDASVWLLDNVLTGNGSILLDVDTWYGSDELEHKSISFSEVYEFYKKRMEPYTNVRSVRNNSDNFFRSNKTDFDFIYIDGDHTEQGVASDAAYAWVRLKSGGILAFDDYLWGQELDPEFNPKRAIDSFLEFYKGEYEILEQGWQVWLQKK